jgi:hypothetical protein
MSFVVTLQGLTLQKIVFIDISLFSCNQSAILNVLMLQ